MGELTSRHIRLVRTIATATVTFTYLATQVVFAHLPETSLWAQRRTSRISEPAVTTPQFSPLPLAVSARGPASLDRLPTSSIVIREVQKTPASSGRLKGRRIVVIQDIHLNAEAQRNTAFFLQELVDRQSVGTIALEGAFGPLNLESIRAFSRSDITRRVADLFLNEALIGAASYVGVTSPSSLPAFVGVDDRRAYDANVQAYRANVHLQRAQLAALDTEAKNIASEKQNAFSPALLSLDRSYDAYERGDQGLAEFFDHLATVVPDVLANASADVKAFQEASRLERVLDFKAAERERTSVLEKLTARLTDSQMRGLLRVSEEHRAGNLSIGAYHNHLSSLFARHGISLEKAPSFERYLRYVALSDGIKADVLLVDARHLADQAFRRLSQGNTAATALIEKGRRLQLERKLISFELTPDEWAEYQQVPGASFLVPSEKRLGTRNQELGTFEEFYRLADARSEAMVRNLTRVSDDTKLTALIVGGFHAPHVTRLLRKEGASFAVVSPRITKLDSGPGSAYLSIFNREKAPLEKLFSGERLFILASSTHLTQPGSPTEDFSQLQKALVSVEENPGQVLHQAGDNATYAASADVPAGYTAAGRVWNFGDVTLRKVRSLGESAVNAGRSLAISFHGWILERLTARRLAFVAAGVALVGVASIVYPEIFGDWVPWSWFRENQEGMAAATLIAGMLTNGRGKSWVSENTPSMEGKRIVEVTMELALSGEALKALEAAGLNEEEMRAAAMNTSTGGIGPLLNERIIAQAALGAHITCVSLLYNHVWLQRVENQNGRETIRLEKVEIGSKLRGILQKDITLRLEMHDGAMVDVDVYKAPAGMYGNADVFFLDMPRITDTVYPGNADAPGMAEAMRLAQNWLLGRGTLALLENKDQRPDLMVMSEMPTVFSFHRLVQDRFTRHPLFEDTQYIFNDHTPLEYAHPYWDMGTLARMRVDPRYYHQLTVWKNHHVDGTAMIVNAADGVYGVAEKHGRTMREMPLLKQFASKIAAVTNGVSSGYWPTGEFGDVDAIDRLADEDLLAIKEEKRQALVRWLAKRQSLGDEWAEKIIQGKNPIGIWTRRITQYKRLDVFAHIVGDPEMRQKFLDTGIVFVVGGRIHQDDNFGINQYNRIQEAIAADPRLRDRVIFFQDYNIWEAPKLFRGAQFSTMLADDKREAAATGFQKAQMNGDLIVFSADGAVIESVYDEGEEANGFEVPYVEGEPKPEGLIDAFQRFKNVYNDDKTYARYVRNALKQSPRVDVARTAKDMLLYFSTVVGKKTRDTELKERGRDIVRKAFQGESIRQLDALRAIEILGKTDFTWKYMRDGWEERELKKSDPGIRGLVNGYRYIKTLGTVGDWSLGYHNHNNHGYGDVIVHLQTVFGAVPELRGLVASLDSLGQESQKGDTEKKIENTKIALGLAEELMDRLERLADTSESRMQAPGQAGFWKGWNIPSSITGALESAGLITLAILAMRFTMVSLSEMAGTKEVAFVQGTSSIGFGLAAAALLIVAAILVVHRMFGVYISEQWPVTRNGEIVSGADRTAFWTLLGLPFLGLAVLFDGISGFAFMALAVGLSITPHATLNPGRARAAVDAWQSRNGSELLLDDVERDLKTSVDELVEASLVHRHGGPSSYRLLHALQEKMSPLGLLDFGRHMRHEHDPFLAPVEPAGSLKGEEAFGSLVRDSSDFRFNGDFAGDEAGQRPWAFRANVFLAQAVIRQRFDSHVSSFQDAFEGEGTDHIVLPVSGTPTQIIGEAREALAMAKKTKRPFKMTVLLSLGNQHYLKDVKGTLKALGIRVLLSSDLTTDRAIRRGFFDPLGGKGQLKLLVDRRAPLGQTDSAFQALFDYVRRHPGSESQIRVIFFRMLLETSRIISTTLPGLDALIEFSKTSGSHA